VNVERQVEYWRESAVDDLEAAALLVEKEKINQSLFFAHLALEKALKALVCRATRSTPLPIHDLSKLAERSEMGFSPEQMNLLDQVSRFQLRGRYELPARPLLPKGGAGEVFSRIRELVLWLISL